MRIHISHFCVSVQRIYKFQAFSDRVLTCPSVFHMFHKDHKAAVQCGIPQGYVCPHYIALHFEGFKLPGGP